MTCAEAREAIGALVLGALDRDEELLVREHIRGCPTCAAEYRELAAIPALLELVSAEQIQYAVDPYAADRMWRGLVDRARAEERGRRRRTWLAATASAVAAGALVIFGTVIVNDDGTDPPAQPPTAAETISGRDEATGVHAMISYEPVGWGTKLSVELGGVAPGAECSLVAVGSDGTRETAASWRVPDTGYPQAGTITMPGAVGMSPDEVTRYEIVTTDGDMLLEVPA